MDGSILREDLERLQSGCLEHRLKAVELAVEEDRAKFGSDCDGLCVGIVATFVERVVVVTSKEQLWEAKVSVDGDKVVLSGHKEIDTKVFRDEAGVMEHFSLKVASLAEAKPEDRSTLLAEMGHTPIVGAVQGLHNRGAWGKNFNAHAKEWRQAARGTLGKIAESRPASLGEEDRRNAEAMKGHLTAIVTRLDGMREATFDAVQGIKESNPKALFLTPEEAVTLESLTNVAESYIAYMDDIMTRVLDAINEEDLGKMAALHDAVLAQWEDLCVTETVLTRAAVND